MRLQRTGESRAHLGALLFLEKGERMRQIPIPQSEIMGYVVFLPEVGAQKHLNEKYLFSRDFWAKKKEKEKKKMCLPVQKPKSAFCVVPKDTSTPAELADKWAIVSITHLKKSSHYCPGLSEPTIYPCLFLAWLVFQLPALQGLAELKASKLYSQLPRSNPPQPCPARKSPPMLGHPPILPYAGFMVP